MHPKNTDAVPGIYYTMARLGVLGVWRKSSPTDLYLVSKQQLRRWSGQDCSASGKADSVIAAALCYKPIFFSLKTQAV